MRLERILPIVPLAAAGVYLYFTEQIGEIGLSLPISGKVFPRILSAGLAVAAVLWFLEAMRAESEPDAVATDEGQGHWWLILVVAAWTGVFYWVFQWLGYVMATTFYLLPLMVYFNRDRWVANIATAVLFSAGSYFAFHQLLGVPLPQGRLLDF